MPEPKPVYHTDEPEIIHAHRLGPYLATLNCRACHSILASVVEWDRRTAVVLFTREGHPCLAFRARLHCECGEERRFFSMPMSAVRLGIDGS